MTALADLRRRCAPDQFLIPSWTPPPLTLDEANALLDIAEAAQEAMAHDHAYAIYEREGTTTQNWTAARSRDYCAAFDRLDAALARLESPDG